MADTCNSFATYTCAQGVHDGAFIGGSGTPIASPGAGLLLSGNSFTVSTHNGAGGADVIILAASANGTPTGTLDGIAFNSWNSFPEGGATGAIVTNLQTAGLCGSTCNLSFAYVDLGKALPANGRGHGRRYQRRPRTRITDADGNRAARFGCTTTAQAARLAKFTLLFLRPRTETSGVCLARAATTRGAFRDN